MVGEFTFTNLGVYTKVSLTLDFIVLPLCYDYGLPVISMEILYFLYKSALEWAVKIIWWYEVYFRKAFHNLVNGIFEIDITSWWLQVKCVSICHCASFFWVFKKYICLQLGRVVSNCLVFSSSCIYIGTNVWLFLTMNSYYPDMCPNNLQPFGPKLTFQIKKFCPKSIYMVYKFRQKNVECNCISAVCTVTLWLVIRLFKCCAV